MEEATMSQHAEMTATDNLEAAELGGAPTQSVKKPSRFSADAFRALSDRLNGSAASVAESQLEQPQPSQPVQNGQIIPDIGLDPSVAPSIELPTQLNSIIPTPSENTANGAEAIVAEPPEPTLVSVLAQQAVQTDPISPDVSHVQDNVESGIPQFAIPQVEIPNFSMPTTNAVAQQAEMVAVLQEPAPVELAPKFVVPALEEPAFVEPAPLEQALPEQVLPEQTLLEQIPVEAAPQGNAAEPGFLDLAQFTQDDPNSNLVPADPVTAIVDAPIQASRDVEPIETVETAIQSHSTNVGSLSLAEMLAAEPQTVADQPAVVVQEAQVVEPTIEPAIVEAIEEVDVQAEVPAPQIEESLVVEPVAEPLAAPVETLVETMAETPLVNSPEVSPEPSSVVSPEASPEPSIVQAEPSLSDLFANQAPTENAQPAFRIPDQEQLNTPATAQMEIQPELPIEVQPELIPEISLEIQTGIEPQAEAQSGLEEVQVDHQFDLQAAIDAQSIPDISAPLNEPVPSPAVENSIQENAPVIGQQIVQETAPIHDVEFAPSPELEELSQEASILATEPSANETEVPAQVEAVLENDLNIAAQEPTLIDELPIDTPTIDATPAASPSFSPQGGLDPLLEAMRLMQEVGPAPSPTSSPTSSPLTEVAEAETTENVPKKVSTQVDIAELGKEDKQVTETRDLDDAKIEPAPAVSAKAEPSKPTELAKTDVDPEYELQLEPDEKSGETARALLDMMSGAGGAAQPQERALAGDTLLQLVPRMLEKDLVSLSERVGMMDEPPALLVNKLINNRSARVAQPLLEGGQVVSDQDLLKLITNCEVDRLTMISKRRIISSGVCDALIGRAEASVYLTLVRNPGASISHDAFISLCEIAKNQQTLQAPLATRGDTPPPIAFELFWALPVELRRYVLSRFLTDSATLDKILKIAQSMGSDNGVEAAGDQHFPTRRKVDELVDLIAEGVIDGAVDMLANLAEIQPDNARRIVTDPDGEPLTVALKTLGISRAKFNKAIKLFSTTPSAPLSAERDLQELQAMFDGLSHNKARTLMKYWDWAVEKSGPYARRSV